MHASVKNPAAPAPAQGTDGATIVGSTLGVVAIVLALFVSGYAAIAAGLLAIIIGCYGLRRHWPVLLGILGIVLGVGAQVLKLLTTR